MSEPTESNEDSQALAHRLAVSARGAASALASATTEAKDQALEAIARQLQLRQAAILEANARDLEAARAGGLSAAMIDRLKLDSGRMKAMISGVRSVIELPDPVGRSETMGERPNGLKISRVRIPLGVLVSQYSLSRYL